MITIENITFGYLPGRRVLSDFSLRFQSGGVYGLLGRNGTGKSTLLYLMSGLLNPQGGRIDIDGFNPQMRCPELLGEVFIVPEEYDLPRVTLGSYVKALKPFSLLITSLLTIFSPFNGSPELMIAIAKDTHLVSFLRSELFPVNTLISIPSS